MNRRFFMRALSASAAVAVTVFAVGSANAEALRDQWCKDVKIRFFVGGAEGDGFGVIVYNGAVQAAHDTGAQVEYVFSGWNNLKDILIALDEEQFITVNHIIWKYQFGVVTSRKFVTSHLPLPVRVQIRRKAQVPSLFAFRKALEQCKR